MSAAKCCKARTITRWLLFIIFLEKTSINKYMLVFALWLMKVIIFMYFLFFLFSLCLFCLVYVFSCSSVAGTLLICAIDPNVAAMTVILCLVLSPCSKTPPAGKPLLLLKQLSHCRQFASLLRIKFVSLAACSHYLNTLRQKTLKGLSG